ncbi:hypothetical protein BDV93DRAFT_523744 [Ceratobasidium sp. AG-I]|nr:hypothetical protein BDV93DRAFT_523744 [Ceratobasidium sp. AG-I]
MWSREMSWACTAVSLMSLLCHSGTADAIALPGLRRQSIPSTSLKAGLGWGGGGNISQFEGHQVGWYFTWSPQSWVTPPPTQLEFVPQLWGGRDAVQFGSVVNTSSVASIGVKHALGMNEPQEPSQANLSPQDAAAMWKTYLEPLKSQGVRLGSPATTSAPNGKNWTQDFFTACAGGCTVDFIALHWYGIVAAEFIAYLEDFHNTFQLPIWITEFSCQNFVPGPQCTYDEIVQFMNTTQTFMDKTEWVERYAWFGAMAALPANVNNLTALMDPSGVINPLGQQYIGPLAGQATPTSVSSAVPSSTSVSAASTSITATPTSTESTISTTSAASTTSHSGHSTTSSRTATSTETPYVIISGASTNSPLSHFVMLLGALLACLASI